MAGRLNHLFMSTSDLDAARRLFVELLDLEILDEGGHVRGGGRHFWFRDHDGRRLSVAGV